MLNERRKNRAIVLLIVLGMLALFSVLVVTYVVFSSQKQQSAYGNSLRRERELQIESLSDSIVRQIVTGGSGNSATYNQDLLNDLYGTDHIHTRVAHQRDTSGSTGSLEDRAMLLRPFLSGTPQTTLFKFPLHFASWHNDGGSATLAAEVVQSLTNAELSDTGSSGYLEGFKDRLRERNLPDYRLSDAFSGRLLTFTEGPLKNNTFRIVRSFGTVPLTSNAEDTALAGSVVIDLAEAKSQIVAYNGRDYNVLELANFNPNALCYSAGDDKDEGLASSSTDALGEFRSDDIGYKMVINGIAFNGLGQNASGASKLTRFNSNSSQPAFVIDPQFGPELLPNRKVTGASLEASQPDEQYDAGDFENWLLAWQPSDHRAILPSVETAIRNASPASIPSDAKAPKAAPNIIPSFHRPEVINYLMHAPILYNGTARSFADLDVSSDPDDAIRLQILARRLRAATFRPLNFDHLFVSVQENTGYGALDPRRKLFSDLDGDGSMFDGNPEFSGSNPTPTLNESIAVNGSNSFNSLKQRIRELAIWMCNGPWDIDNDGDGIPDSVWTDFDLPTQLVGNGTVVKPLVAVLIEDMDGRININTSGNYAQITSRRFQGANPTSYSDDASYLSAMTSLQTFGRGGGIGTAEINFSHLFDEYRPTDPGNTTPPLYINQTSNPFAAVLSTRYGNLLQSRYGGTPWGYSTAYSYTTNPIAHPGTSPVSDYSDPFSRILLPQRRDNHTTLSPMGRSLDLFGRSTTRKLPGGNAIIDAVAADVPAATPSAGERMTELSNHPYELDIDDPVGDDRPFTPADFYSFVNQGSATALGSRLTELLGDAAKSNPALTRLLTVESRSLDHAELPGGKTVAEFIVDRLPMPIRTNASFVNQQIERMVAVEFRKGSKLNLNRPLSNGKDDNADLRVDDAVEVEQTDANDPTPETAFPWLNEDVNTGNIAVTNGDVPQPQSLTFADYLPLDIDASTVELPKLTGAELLARNLYCIMFRLIIDPTVDPTDPSQELVPNFPYPTGLQNEPTPNIPVRNRFVARRLAQWAANAVDMRDTDPAMTRLRYDPNPFDADGFDLTKASSHVVWGMERPEIALSESLAFHDRRVKRNLDTKMDPMNPSVNPDGEDPNDEDSNPGDMKDPDSDLDQFRIPEASAIVEIRSLRDPYLATSATSSLESYPAELYEFSSGTPKLDLGRVAGAGANVSPVWRLAVGYTSNSSPHSPDATGYQRSVLWTTDAERVDQNAALSAFGAYTVNPADYTYQDPDSEWYKRAQALGDITNPLNSNNSVSLYDDDLDPTNGTPKTVPLSRFVWFTSTVPNASHAILSAQSGMTLSNVFYNANVLGNSVPAYLPGGGYAVVAPRDITILGQTEQSTQTNSYEYHPSNQRFEYIISGGQHSLRYTDIRGQRGSPDYFVDNNSAYRVNNVLAINAVSLPPHQTITAPIPYVSVATNDPNLTINSWRRYFDDGLAGGDKLGLNTNERVGVGFNISAPLSGPNYYYAPTKRINNNGTPYPMVDGYRDYTLMPQTTDPDNLHEDVPFDERNGAPLRDLNIVGVGTYQDVANLFLQRLADPSQPWDATNNPYITVDAMTMDLTVFNGEDDLRKLIDRDGDGTVAEPVDPFTPAYPTQLAFDTRRKIPDPALDRPTSSLLLKTPGDDPNVLANYERYVVAQRSSLMTTQNLLRPRGETTLGVPNQEPFFRHELTSAWTDGTASSSATNLHSGYRFDLTRQRFDVTGDKWPQTLGFVNREVGEPAQAFTTLAASSNSSSDAGRYVGYPINVLWQLPTWLDRPYQSPFELMMVPATSASRLGQDYGPGSNFDPTTSRDTPDYFPYLLGFDRYSGSFPSSASPPTGTLVSVDPMNDPNINVSIPDESDLRNGPASGLLNLSNYGTNYQTLSNLRIIQNLNSLAILGHRPGFEQIFDVVDIGAISFGQRRWLDPTQSTRLTPSNTRDAMFNRATQLLQPPFNYSERHRTAGKVNLNTTPDYIRQGGGFESAYPVTNSGFQHPFTTGTNPEQPWQAAGLISGVTAEPTNYREGKTGDPFNTAVLYGNGSVYRSISGGISTAYDLDDTAGETIALGEYDNYKQSVDSRFGYGFKQFIQSRRGYPTSFFNASGSWSSEKFFNLDLDFRYPSRFAGMFAPNAAASLPSVQKYLLSGKNSVGTSAMRRTYDMGLTRLNPDFDYRLMEPSQRTNAQPVPLKVTSPPVAPTIPNAYTLRVEADSTGASVTLPNLTFAANASSTPDPTSTLEVENLRMPLVNTALFERSQADLHKNFRGLDHDPFFKYKNQAQLANLTTHHSNVYMVRYTVGFFVVEPTTGAFGEEYFDAREGFKRPKGFCLIDRSIPVGYISPSGINPTSQSQSLNALDTVLFSITN